MDYKKLFTYVASADVTDFVDSHIGKDSTDAYYGKIVFLEGTGEIATHGKIFAWNNDASVQALFNTVGDSSDPSTATTLYGLIAKAQATAEEAVNAAGVTSLVSNDDYLTLNSSVGAISADLSTAIVTGTRLASGTAADLVATGDGLLTSADIATIKNYIDDTKQSILTGDETGTINDAYDTLKEVADWITDDASGAAALVKRVADVSADVADVSSDLADTSSRLNDVSSRLDDASSRLDDVSSRLDDASSRLDDVSTAVDTLNGDDSTEGSVAKSIKDAIEALDSSANDASAGVSVKVTEEDGKISAVDVDVTAAVATYTAKTETDAATLTVDSSDNVLTGDAIGAIKSYVDAVAAGADDAIKALDVTDGSVADTSNFVKVTYSETDGIVSLDTLSVTAVALGDAVGFTKNDDGTYSAADGTVASDGLATAADVAAEIAADELVIATALNDHESRIKAVEDGSIAIAEAGKSDTDASSFVTVDVSTENGSIKSVNVDTTNIAAADDLADLIELVGAGEKDADASTLIERIAALEDAELPDSLDKEDTSIYDTNSLVGVTYSEADGIVTISNVDVSTATYDSTTSTLTDGLMTAATFNSAMQDLWEDYDA